MVNQERVPIIKIILIGFLPSFIKKFYYISKGYKIGKEVKFSLGSVISASEKCEIKGRCKIGFFTTISCRILEIGYGCQIRSLVIMNANEIKLGNDVIISETAIIRAGHNSEKSNLTIENRVHIFPKTIIDPTYPITLGEECAIGFYSNVYTHGSYKSILEGYKVSYGPVTIGKRVELTYNVFIAPGVKIGDDAIIAYGSYVNKDIPEGVLAAGCPAQIKRTRNEFAPVPTNEEKVKIIVGIINEFCIFLKYNKVIDSFESNDNLWLLKFKRKNKIQKIGFFKDDFNYSTLNNNDIFLFFNLKNVFFNSEKFKRVQFFDLSAYECSPEFSSTGKELKRFLKK